MSGELETCATCKFSRPGMTPDRQINLQVRVCKRTVPQCLLVPAGPNAMALNAFWPEVGSGDWCGEWQRKGGLLPLVK